MKSLILLHGALGSSAQLAPLKETLLPFFDVHLPGLPGQGGNKTDAFTIPAFAAIGLSMITFQLRYRLPETKSLR